MSIENWWSDLVPVHVSEGDGQEFQEVYTATYTNPLGNTVHKYAIVTRSDDGEALFVLELKGGKADARILWGD